MWSHDIVATSVDLATDLKLGQYLKVPPRAMFLTREYNQLSKYLQAISLRPFAEIWGVIIGSCHMFCSFGSEQTHMDFFRSGCQLRSVYHEPVYRNIAHIF